MNTYIISVREVHVSHRQVEASSPKEALEILRDGGDEELYMEYSHQLDENTWGVTQVDKGGKEVQSWSVDQLR